MKYKYFELTIKDQVTPKLGHHNVNQNLYLEEVVLLVEKALIIHSVYPLVPPMRGEF